MFIEELMKITKEIPDSLLQKNKGEKKKQPTWFCRGILIIVYRAINYNDI